MVLSLNFLAQSLGVNPTGFDDEEIEEVTVTGAAPRRRQVQPDLRSAPSPSFTEELLPREGRFGVKGTLRDILGTVGDAFLINHGASPMYAPQRQMEKEASALYDFTENPEEALERLAAINPQRALELSKQVATQRHNQASLERDTKRDQQKVYDTAVDTFLRVAGAASPESWSRIVPILQKIKERGGLGDEFLVPEDFDPDLIDSYRRGGMKTHQQVTTDLTAQRQQDQKSIEEEKLKIRRDEEAGRNRRATEAEAGRDRRQQPSRAGIAAPILEKIQRGEPITRAERAILDRMYPESRRRRSGGGIPPLPEGFTARPVGQQ